MITISVSPIAFTIGPFEVRWYGIMVALAIVVIVLWLLWRVRRGARLTADSVFSAALVGVPSGVIFARLLHVLDDVVIARLHPELVASGAVIDYTRHPGLIFGAAGLTIYGAVLGAALGIWIYSRFSRFNFNYFADVVAPGVVLAQVVGRVGCTLNGCCYGDECSLPWAIVYTNPQSYGPIGVPVHPTQIYEIIFLLLLFGGLLWLRKHLTPDGSLFLVYLSAYSLWRLGIGFLRVGNPFFFGLEQAQVLGIIVLAIAVPLLTYRTRWVGRAAGDDISPTAGP